MGEPVGRRVPHSQLESRRNTVGRAETQPQNYYELREAQSGPQVQRAPVDGPLLIVIIIKVVYSPGLIRP